MTTNRFETLADVPAAMIVAGNNDRKHFDPAGLDELAQSIARDGLAQRPVVREVGDGAVEIVAGERRVRAMRDVLGWATIPVVIRELTDRQASAIMLAENVSRVDLDVVSEASAYRARMDEFGLSVGQVAEWAGVSAARVITRLPVLDVVEEARDLARTGQLSLNHCRSMADLDGNRQRIALRAHARGLSYFEFSDLCQRLRNEQAAEGLELFAMTVDEYVVDAKAGRANKALSQKALLAAMADALEAAGLADDLVAAARDKVAGRKAA